VRLASFVGESVCRLGAALVLCRQPKGWRTDALLLLLWVRTARSSSASNSTRGQQRTTLELVGISIYGISLSSVVLVEGAHQEKAGWQLHSKSTASSPKKRFARLEVVTIK